MSLRYSFRHLFYGGKIQKERLYKVLKDLDDANGGETTDITSLKTTVGDSSKGLVKDVADHTTAIGKASGEGAGGILKDIKDIKDIIGDADEPAQGTILYRLAQLETDDTEPNG